IQVSGSKELGLRHRTHGKGHQEVRMDRTFTTAGAVAALLGVAFGAFGAHGLEGHLTPPDLATFETGVRYQMYHAFGLLVTGWALADRPSAALRAAGRLFLAGIVLFSGSLYVLVLTGPRWLGAV